jgi:hypothetical protein
LQMVRGMVAERSISSGERNWRFQEVQIPK